MASNAKPASSAKRTCLGGASAPTVSGEETEHASLMRARTAQRWLWLARAPWTDAAPTRDVSSSAPGRGKTCQLWPPTPSRVLRVTRRGAGARCLCEGGSALELSEWARRLALIAIAPYSMEARYTDRRRFSIGTPPWCDVRAETSNTKPAAACEASAGEPPLAVSDEEAELPSLLLRVRRAALVVLGQRSI